MKTKYNIGYIPSTSDKHLDDVKQALIDKGVATEDTPNSELDDKIKNLGGLLKSWLDIKKSCKSMFSGTPEIVEANFITYNDTSNVTNMDYMFGACTNLKTIPLLDTSKVTIMSQMVSSCSNLITIPQLDTSNVTNMGTMFAYCTKLESVPQLDTSKVVNMGAMFRECTNLKTIPPLDTSNVKYISYMFYQCTNLESVPPLDTKNITDISYMFTNCKKLITIEGLNLINVTSSVSMFDYCSQLTNLTLYNILPNLKIGSGTSWGNLLTLNSLINTCKECIKQSASRTLTMGSTNKNKLTNVYVKFTDTTQTTIAEGEKGDVVVCESTDEGAMTITEYMTLKNWTLA